MVLGNKILLVMVVGSKWWGVLPVKVVRERVFISYLGCVKECNIYIDKALMKQLQ